MVIVATQGHGDEEAVEQAVAARPAYLGLVGSRRRGAAVLGYLADRGLPADQLDRVHVPAGLDLGHTTHQEIAVAILAELVQLRASGALAGAAGAASARQTPAPPASSATSARAPAAGRGRRPGLRYDRRRRGRQPPAGPRRRDLLLLLHRLPPEVRAGSGCLRDKGNPMLIKNEFQVAAPIDKVWQFFGDIPQVAACLPGTELTDDLGGDSYEGRVAVRMGPVRLQFAGKADITERDEAAKRLVVNATGAEEKGRGQASMVVTATLAPAGRGTKVSVAQDLQLSGAAAQYGRGMISDVTAVLMRDFSVNLADRIDRAAAR